MSSLPPLLRQALESTSIDPASLSISGNIATSSSPSSSGLPESYFIKSTSTTSSTLQLVGEARGLLAMAATCPSLVPRVHAHLTSPDGTHGATVSTHFVFSRGGSGSGPNVQRELGQALARMHRVPPKDRWADLRYREGQYGFDVPTHCGATEQDNKWEGTWEVFWRDRRLGDLVRRIGDRQVDEAWKRLKSRAVPVLLGTLTPAPEPVIIHGDLWSGNYGVEEHTSQARIFDPASYWGHNEAELGMTHMFGGFTKDFYDAYHEIHPRSEPHYEQRIKLYELYHHLNHALMFGGSYKTGALGIMRSLSDWADGLPP